MFKKRKTTYPSVLEKCIKAAVRACRSVDISLAGDEEFL